MSGRHPDNPSAAAGQPALPDAIRKIQEKFEAYVAQKLVLDEYAIVSLADRDRRITYVNDRFCEITKYDRFELIGQPYDTLSSGHHTATYFEEMWKTVERDGVWHGEIENRAKDGSYYWVKCTTTSVQDLDGRIIGYAEVQTDITQQKYAEQEAIKARARLDLALRSSGVVLWDMDPTLGTLELSGSFGIVFGYPLDDFPMDTAGLLNLVHPEDFEVAQLFVERLRTHTGREVIQELRLRTYASSFVWVRLAGRATGSGTGRLHAFGALSDVTAEKEIARSMSDEKQALERIVVERTKELEEALDKERELNEIQRQFVAMASHEFRTPLAIIDSAAQHVIRRIKKLSPEDVVEGIETIRGAVRRMTNLMESTLSAAKMDAGKLRVQSTDCGLRALLKDVCHQQQRIAPRHRVTTDLDGLPETIQADPAALELVFANLLSNAAKYAPDAPEVFVRGWCDGDSVFVSVQDQGIGIDEEDTDKLFSRFFRAKSAAEITGTGIGLNLVKRLVDSHGGEITVDSAIGSGSTFTVKLPIRGGEEDEARAAA